MKLILRPWIPPFSFTSFAHKRTASPADWPSNATGPLSGVHMPMRILLSVTPGSARKIGASATDATVAMTAKDSRRTSLVMEGSLDQLEQGRNTKIGLTL